ncbi:MAG: hypothetical protein HY692_05855 [Cyanobacteria bacterium NC_groundwater_1444_Ag_S-0.65um_54_12]|nr:hypothetical protein [Cyanobacteria bacterium NC_groundwater_1444_Ag_S-0.65um_54_12]
MTARLLIKLWTIGFLVSFVIQTIFQGAFADSTAWGRNNGWQNEIAFWNLGVSVLLLCLLRVKDAPEKSLPGLAVLSLFLGVNHLIAAMSTSAPGHLGHLFGFVANAIAVVLVSVYWIRTSRRGEDPLVARRP